MPECRSPLTAAQLADALALRQLTALDLRDYPVRRGCAGDLLSWIMAHEEGGTAWVTVQTHLSTVAVACSLGFACVIVAGGAQVAPATIQRADEERMPLLSSPESVYRLCCSMCRLGIGC